MKQIFLHGAVLNQSIEQLNKFGIAESELTAAGFNVVTAMLNHPDKEELMLEPFVDYMKARRKAVLECDMLVYLDDYKTDQFSEDDVEAARRDIKMIPVMEYNYFKERYVIAAGEAEVTLPD